MTGHSINQIIPKVNLGKGCSDKPVHLTGLFGCSRKHKRHKEYSTSATDHVSNPRYVETILVIQNPYIAIYLA